MNNTSFSLTFGSIFANIMATVSKDNITFGMSIVIFLLAAANHIISIHKNSKK